MPLTVTPDEVLKNHLLAALSDEERTRIKPGLEFQHFKLGEVL